MGDARIRAAAMLIGLSLIGAGCGEGSDAAVRDAARRTPLTPADAPVGSYEAAGTDDGLVLAAGLQGTGTKAVVLPGAFRWTAKDGWTPLHQLPDGFAAVGGAEVGDRVYFVGKDCSGVDVVSTPDEECDGNLLAELVDGGAWDISEIPAAVMSPESSIGVVRQVEGRYLSVVPEGSRSAALVLYDPKSGDWSDVGYPDGMGPAMNQLCQTDGNTFAGTWTQLESNPSRQQIRYRMWALGSDLTWGEPTEVTATVVDNGSTTVCGLGSMMFQTEVGRQAVLERTDRGITSREISVPEPIVGIPWGAGRIGDRVVGPPRTPDDASLTELGTRRVDAPVQVAVESPSALYLVSGTGALPDVQAFLTA